MREYNVALKEGIDYDGFWNDIESDTDGGKLYIPNRAVEFTNERPASLRQCWYLLTDEEAELLRGDDRVFCVEIPPEHRTDIKIGRNATQKGVFTKTTLDSGNYQNWGLIRANSLTNNYGTGTTTSENYNYTLTGKGVDVVIQDSGLQVDHPEFQDEWGVSRVQQINWATVSGLGFSQSPNHYRDYDGHGTHVAGIAVGKTFGWAKNAKIYSVKVSGLEGNTDTNTGISVTYCFDAIKVWHTAKAGSRPTVVNMSWGYSTYYDTVSSLTYRGTSYTDASTTGNSSYRESNYGLIANSGGANGTYSSPVRIGSVDVDVEEMISAGIVVCIAAGNNYHKIDASTGVDYNNFVVTNGGTIYYHRGSSPYSPNAIIVGSMDSTAYNATNDQKATYSCCGSGVDIYAPGTNIMSACSNTNAFSGPSYYLNASYKQCNISGTSMASPQVAGVSAMLSEIYPKATPAQIKASLLANTGTALLRFNNVTTFTTTANGSSNYVINGSSNPTLTLIEGETYTFNLSVSGHPFYIKTNQSTGTGDAYNTGVTNNGASTGEITFTVPVGAPATLYYNCQFHSGMRGTINIVSTINNDWTDNITLKGGLAKVLYNKYNQADTFTATGPISFNTTLIIN
jgi:subtilisin family serine protease